VSIAPRNLARDFANHTVASGGTLMVSDGHLCGIQEPMLPDAATSSIDAGVAAAPPVSPQLCAAALRRRLREYTAAPGGAAVRICVYPQSSANGHGPGVRVLADSGTERSLDAFGPQPAAGTAEGPRARRMLSFSSNFEGGNLRTAWALSATEYELHLACDLSNPAHCQWFYFQVSGMEAGVEYNFHMVNLGKPTSLFEEGTQPVILSKRGLAERGIGWTRAGYDIAYLPNGAVLEKSGKVGHTLSFALVFPYSGDEVSIAHFFPYGYGDLRRDMELWTAGKSSRCKPVSSNVGERRQATSRPSSAASVPASTGVRPPSAGIRQKDSYVASTPASCASQGSRPPSASPSSRQLPLRAEANGVPDWWPTPASQTPEPSWRVERWPMLQTTGGLTVDAFNVGARVGTRPTALLIARAHPGESPASWVMRGACNFLLGDPGPEASACRAACHWVIVPMLNPDGVVVGNTRTNFTGVDLNRHHHDDIAQETRALRSLVAASQPTEKPYNSTASGAIAIPPPSAKPPLVFVDMHGHSRRRGVFLMGNSGGSVKLPVLLSRRTELFDLSGSSMLGCGVSGKDAGIGRVAMASRAGVPHSFTLEASFGMPHEGQHQLAPDDLESFGRALCLAILDLATESTEGPTSEDKQSEAVAAGLMGSTAGADD